MAGAGETEPDSYNAPFPETYWKVISSARAGSPEAISILGELYWQPVYSWLRRKGRPPEDAADVTQAFFLRALETRLFGKADRSRGRFRTYLLACLRNFLADRHDLERTLKRGGRLKIERLNIQDAERELAGAVTDDPDWEFDRQCAAEVLERATAQLRRELEAKASEVFSLAFGGESLSHAEIGRRAGMSEGAVTMSIARSRGRLREILLAEMGLTGATPEDADEEVTEFLNALSRRAAEKPRRR